MLFSDKCKFSRWGVFNRQECLARGSERPNVDIKWQKTDHPLWFAAPYRKKVIGPSISEIENVRGETCKRILRYCAFLKLREYPIDTISTEWCSSSLLRSCTSLFGPKVPYPLHAESWTHFIASSLTGLDALDMYFMYIFEKYLIQWASKHKFRAKTKNTHVVAGIDENGLKKSTKNMVNRLCVVLREGGGHFEDHLNCKTNTFTVSNLHHWAPELIRCLTNCRFDLSGILDQHSVAYVQIHFFRFRYCQTLLFTTKP